MNRFLKAILIIFFFSNSFASEIKFTTAEIRLGAEKLNVEIAKTDEEQTRGLMFRKTLDENSGMLFVYSDEAPRSFWMKNTFIPLSIGFFNKKKELIEIQDMKPVASEMQTNIPTYRSVGPAMYALEVPSGWFIRHKIKQRMRFSFTEKIP